MITDLGLVKLLQLVSPALPIGMYSYSQGLERAVEDAWVRNEQQAGEWIAGVLERCQTRTDLPCLSRLYDAWVEADVAAVEHWSTHLLAYRETGELRTEDRLSGQALARVLVGLNVERAGVWVRKPSATLATCFSLAAVSWGIPKFEAALGYLWSWLENQVLCAVKLVPLGQAAGQRLLSELAERLPGRVTEAFSLTDDEIGGSAFGLALASSRHEVQYSRLFRS
ncbi:urease accessory protein UreF [Methylocaldum sp.]|uniref:urease accessory protein UreF n=1 Tax=Methylocaldum sp. TaxID=1969727 RepID=UPI002D625B2F|nr:urease accessory protein UreF [Methylocaldum sp.]HYE37243.1 urease accessory protein UreF [Methylocaldum sp.]